MLPLRKRVRQTSKAYMCRRSSVTACVTTLSSFPCAILIHSKASATYGVTGMTTRVYTGKGEPHS